MRTSEQQRKLLHDAQLHPWDVSNAIRSCGMSEDDKEDMIRTVNATYFDDAWEQFRALDTIVRDTLLYIIEETIYGTKTAAPPEKTASALPFTDAELFMLSDALIAAISANNKASSLAAGASIRDAIREENKKLAALNTKICNMMEDEQ